MWSDPIGTIEQMTDKAIGYADEGHASGNFFLGSPVDDPGWLFYPVAAAFRLSPLALVGLVAGLARLVRGDRSERRFDFGMLLLYSLLFSAFMNVGAKKFDRYILPIFPALNIVAAFGMLWIVTAVRKRAKPGSGSLRLAFALLCVAALMVQGVLLLPHSPYYLTYFNPLLGGLRQASTTLLVGWGEGYERLAEHLNARPNAQELQIAAPSVSVLSSQFEGDTIGMARYTPSQTDYVIFYISHEQRLRYEDLAGEYRLNPQVEPEYVVNLHGVDYAWLYPNTYHVEPTSYIDEYSQPGQECLLANGDDVFAKHYMGDLPLCEFYTHWSNEEMRGLLEDLPAGCERMWYARYFQPEDRFAHLLEKQSLQLTKETFSQMEVSLYQPTSRPATNLLSREVQYENLRLHSYTVTDPAPAWGQVGGVFVEWEAVGTVDEDYSAFVHIYDAHGTRIAQQDRLITDEYLRRTSQWSPGTSGWTLHQLTIPPGTPPGRYTMEVGVYLLDTGRRLPLLNPQGDDSETAAHLEIEVGVSRAPEVADLRIPFPLGRQVTPQMELLGYTLESNALVAGQSSTLRLYWEALEGMGDAYRLRVGLRGADGREYAWRTVDLVSTDYPTDQWRVGEILHESYEIATDEHMPTGEATVELNLVDEAGQLLLTAPVEVAQIWVQSTKPGFEAPEHIEQPREIDLGNQVTLLGYDLGPETVKPGEEIQVTLHWQAQREMSISYKVFVHLYDDGGNIVGQQDRVPGLGVRPTVDWEIGEVLSDRYSLLLGPDFPAGHFRLAVGMYDPGTGERLAAYGSDGERLENDTVLLAQIEVRP
jgi:hypothetical protein